MKVKIDKVEWPDPVREERQATSCGTGGADCEQYQGVWMDSADRCG